MHDYLSKFHRMLVMRYICREYVFFRNVQFLLWVEGFCALRGQNDISEGYHVVPLLLSATISEL